MEGAHTEGVDDEYPQKELNLADLKWVTSWSDRNASANEESVLVLDLQSLDPDASAAAEFLRWADLKATVVGFGGQESIKLARAKLSDFDVSFLLRPDCLTDETAALKYVYNQLAEVYATSLVRETEVVVPAVSEIDSAFIHPPFELRGEQFEELLKLASRSETEERLE